MKSGPSHLPVTEKSAGSNPVGTARRFIMNLKNKILLVICLFTLFLPITLIFIVASIAMGLEDCAGKVMKW